MPSVGNYIEVIVYQQQLNQQIINVHQYEITNIAGAGDLNTLVANYFNDVLAPLAALQSDTLEYIQLDCNNLSVPTEFAQLPISEFGTDMSEAMPTYTAASCKIFRPTKLTRNGYRRIGGLVVGQVDESSMTTAARAAIATAMAHLISDTVVGDGTDDVTIQGVIIGRNSDGSYDLSRVQTPSVLQIQEFVTTQRSRKVGVGR